jgi:hypothetical protein
MAARRGALRLAARVVEQRLNADQSDHSGSQLSCPCGSQARYAGRRRKTFQSVLGELELNRAYYHLKNVGKASVRAIGSWALATPASLRRSSA